MTNEATYDDLMREAAEAESRGDFKAADHLLGLALIAALESKKTSFGVWRSIFRVGEKMAPGEGPRAFTRGDWRISVALQWR